MHVLAKAPVRKFQSVENKKEGSRLVKKNRREVKLAKKLEDSIAVNLGTRHVLARKKGNDLPGKEREGLCLTGVGVGGT